MLEEIVWVAMRSEGGQRGLRVVVYELVGVSELSMRAVGERTG